MNPRISPLLRPVRPSLRTLPSLIMALAHPVSAPAAQPSSVPLYFLQSQHDRFHLQMDVYSDAGAAGNHFVEKGRISSPGEEEAVAAMDDAWTDRPASGRTCIRCAFNSRLLNWGGWVWMNGTLRGEERAPSQNWGETPAAGLDLRGARALKFKVRSAKGGEQVEFFCLGVGWHPDFETRIGPFPDSSRKAASGFITLTTNWQEHFIPLSGRDLSYVLGGFGWVANAPVNGRRDITFFIDDVRFDLARPDQPRFLASYVTATGGHDFDQVMQNVAFTYDNAVALLAFLAADDHRRAKSIADALVYAMGHDRFYADGRIRNAYQAGDLTLPPGWAPLGKRGVVRMPGWFDTKVGQWLEDQSQVGSSAGNVAWSMIALLAAYDILGNKAYLVAAESMGEWVERNCRDERGAGGYTAGFEGWEPSPRRLTFKATEHNIDLVAAFRRLANMTRQPAWRDRANHAQAFVAGMWDAVDGKFWTGTDDDGITVNRDNIPLDIQAWAVLALAADGKPYWRALDYAEKHYRVRGGFDFNQDRDGIWPEGTAQMSAAYQFARRPEQGRDVLAVLQSLTGPDGALPAAEKDGLTTGFHLSSGQPWHYFHRSHVGATAWAVLAAQGVNPFWLGKAPK